MMSLVEVLAEFKEKESVSDILKANWYTIATTALAASSAGPEVVKVYRFATKDLDLEKQKLVQRRIKEAVIKTSILYGGPKALQALFPLFKDLKEEEIDSYGPRYESLNDPNDSEKRKEKGRHFFEKLWTPGAAQENLDFNKKYSPDLYLMTLHSLEWYVSEDAVLNFVETELVNSAALTCSNCPMQAMWHTRGIVRHGGTIEQARFAQEVALKIAEMYGAKTGEITPVDQIDFDDEGSHA